ncbi:MAG TPA: hypothetical protein V6D03_06335, partial [Candidatus Caenarcaniphilales bacterium]
DSSAFTPAYLVNHDWLQQFQPATAQAQKQLQAEVPALSRLVDRCSVLETKKLILVRATCLSSQTG